MDIGYSDSEESEVDVNDLFRFDESVAKRRKIGENFDVKILNDLKFEQEEQEQGSAEENEEEEESKGLELNDKKAEDSVIDFDVDKFYKENKQHIEEGQLNEKDQLNISEVSYRDKNMKLSSIISFNLKHEEKIEHKNEERKRRERDLKKK